MIPTDVTSSGYMGCAALLVGRPSARNGSEPYV